MEAQWLLENRVTQAARVRERMDPLGPRVSANDSLWLRINDDGVGDNAGTLDVEIDMDDFADRAEPRPEEEPNGGKNVSTRSIQLLDDTWEAGARRC